MNTFSQESPAALVENAGLRHIAFILDGNGRWANARMMPREAGHKAGADNFKKIVRYCRNIGIRYCTVYAFSTE
ncbi:MAG: undecaprenyl diphosphate synthase family protein, partial [Clostridia bacterium]|nr:undecaprenyl diphosphate synthase family protein [Clostridia bacterium]